MMTGQGKIDEAFFTLLRAGLWEKAPDELYMFPLTDSEWNTVFSMSRKQTVTALVYNGICLMPERLFPPQGILLKWVAAVDAIEKLNDKMNKCLCGLYGWFALKGLEPVVQKGQGLASFYERPLSRECGDIDLYFPRKEDMLKAIDIVRGEGLMVKAMSDGSYSFRFHNADVEIHPFLADICNPLKRKHLMRMEEKFGYIKTGLKGCDTRISIPSPFVNLLLINTHILKHAFGWGIGLRQICDMARACYRLNGCYSKTEMKKYCKDLGISGWTRLLNAFMVDYLGIEEKFLPFGGRSKSAAVLKEIVMEGGNFGMERDGRKTDGVSKLKAKFNTVRSFCGNIGFALRYAPAEGFWTFVGLAKGQL